MSDKVRVHEIAKELGIVSKEVVDKAAEMGIDVKTASSSVSMEDAENIMNYIMGAAATPTPKPSKPVVKKAAAKKRDEEPAKKDVADVTEKKQETIEQPEEKPVEEVKADTAKTVEADKTPEAEKPAPKEEAPVKEKVQQAAVAKEPKASLIKEVLPIKRSGLRIKKKKRPVVTSDSLAQRSNLATKVSSYGKISSDVLEELAKKKSRKKVGKSSIQKK